MEELIFLVEKDLEGGYTARALGASIFTEAADQGELRSRLRDAIRCHFDERHGPRVIRLHFAREEIIICMRLARDVPASSVKRKHDERTQ